MYLDILGLLQHLSEGLAELEGIGVALDLDVGDWFESVLAVKEGFGLCLLHRVYLDFFRGHDDGGGVGLVGAFHYNNKSL